jgi:hypothetical protein
MASPGIAGLHLVRFGTAADQEYFLRDFADTYEQIVVNANMVAHMPSAMASFLAIRAQKPFFIDPQTHAFQHAIDQLLSTSKKSGGEIKRSWKTIRGHYGDPIARIFQDATARALLPDDFSDTDETRDFCARVIEFQNDELSRQLARGPDADYIKYLAEESGQGGDDIQSLVTPSLLVAPYFFLDTQFFEEWLSTNIRCLELSREVLRQKGLAQPLAAQLLISQEILSNERFRARLVETYLASAAKPEVFLLWIDRFAEQEKSDWELKNYISLVADLTAKGAFAANLYGGYFSVIVARSGVLQNKLVGVCHGLEYGESKPAIPISGGIPTAKFYAPPVHSRLASRVAVRVIRNLDGFRDVNAFHTRICDCRVCKAVIRKDPENDFKAFTETKASAFWRAGRRVAMDFPTAKASDLCAKHYMWCKHREYTETRPLDDTCDSLEQAFAKLKAPVGLDQVGHCSVWPHVLRERA